jgi:hypothetical protein
MRYKHPLVLGQLENKTPVYDRSQYEKATVEFDNLVRLSHQTKKPKPGFHSLSDWQNQH